MNHEGDEAVRDPELMRALLEEMDNDSDGPGRLFLPPGTEENDDEARRYHHGELLADCGHAAWIWPESGAAPSFIRITNDGYDFLKAVQNHMDGQERWRQMLGWLREGVAWIEAAKAVVQAVAEARRVIG